MDNQRKLQVVNVHSNSARVVVLAVSMILSAVLVSNWFFPQKAVIGATADVREVESGFTFKARVDTGASICSLHCREIVVEDSATEPESNSGKKVRFLLEDSVGDTHWLSATILGYSGVRSALGTTSRYRVRMRLNCQGVEKETLVSLNDRSEMKYPLLLGRDFLVDDFIVDVSRDNPDVR